MTLWHPPRMRLNTSSLCCDGETQVPRRLSIKLRQVPPLFPCVAAVFDDVLADLLKKRAGEGDRAFRIGFAAVNRLRPDGLHRSAIIGRKDTGDGLVCRMRPRFEVVQQGSEGLIYVPGADG